MPRVVEILVLWYSNRMDELGRLLEKFYFMSSVRGLVDKGLKQICNKSDD